MFSEKAYEVWGRGARHIGELVYGDSLVHVCVDVGEHLEHALVARPLLWRGFLQKARHEHEHGTAQAHLLPKRHCVVALHVANKGGSVVVRLWVALWQHGLRVLGAHALKHHSVNVAGLHLGGKVVMLKDVGLALEAFVDVEIIMAEDAVALACVAGVGWYHIQMSWAQRCGASVGVKPCFTLGDEVDACEG